MLEGLEWKEVPAYSPRYAKYFRYFEARQGQHTYYNRIPRDGCEHLALDHRPIEEIEADLSTDVDIEVGITKESVTIHA
jgi:hypothetical protein